MGVNAGQSLTFGRPLHHRFLLGPAAVGIYSVTSTISEVLRIVPGSVGTGLAIQLAFRHSSLNEARRTRTTMLFLMVPPLVILGWWAPEIVLFVFGPEFEGATLPLRVLLFGELAIMSFQIDSRQLIGLGQLWRAGVAGLASVLCVVGLDFALIPQFELVGAAVASVLAYFLLGALARMMLRRAVATKSVPGTEAVVAK